MTISTTPTEIIYTATDSSSWITVDTGIIGSYGINGWSTINSWPDIEGIRRDVRQECQDDKDDVTASLLSEIRLLQDEIQDIIDIDKLVDSEKYMEYKENALDLISETRKMNSDPVKILVLEEFLGVPKKLKDSLYD